MLDKVSPQSMADEHLLPAALLEMGDSLNFIEVRKHTLRREIKDSKLSAAAGKFSGLGAIVGGVALAALSNPLGWLIGGCGLTAYTLSVFGQWLQTGKVHPMPLSSKSQAERDEDLAGQTVSGDGGNLTGRTAIHEEAAYLSDREKTEYELLHFAPQGLMSAMNNVPPAQRWACYQFLVDAFAAGTIGDYANPQTLKAVLGNPSVYSSHLPEASKRFPQYGLPAVETPQSQSESLPAEIATSSPIGTQTRLNAVEANVSSDGNSPALFNPAIDLGQNPQSALIAGVPGSGKGILVSNAVRVLRQNHQALKVMMIDPKGDPKEKGYWAPVTDVYRSMNLMDCDDPDEGASWLLACMDEFRKLPAPKLLIFDEMLAASVEISLAHKDFKAPQRMKKFVSGIIAQGDSQAVWLWAMSQSVQVADLGFGGGVRGNLRVIGIISPKNTTAIEALTSTRLIPPPTGGMDELREIMKASPVDRAFYDGKLSRWLPMPKLENHSGFDRDNRTIEAANHPEKAPDLEPQNKSVSPVDQLNKMFQSEAFTPDHEDDEVAPEQTGTVMSIAEDLIKYIKSKPDVEVWSISTVRKANKKYRRYDDISLIKAFHILSLSDEGRWDGEKFRPS